MLDSALQDLFLYTSRNWYIVIQLNRLFPATCYRPAIKQLLDKLQWVTAFDWEYFSEHELTHRFGVIVCFLCIFT